MTLVLISRFSIWLSVFLSVTRFYNLRLYSIEKGFWIRHLKSLVSSLLGNLGQCISYLLLCGNSKLSCFKNNHLLFLMILWAGCTQLRASSVVRGTFCLPAFFFYLGQKNNAEICFSEHFFKWDNALKVISMMPGPFVKAQ